jgi:putative hydrolase of the HAD superfamily
VKIETVLFDLDETLMEEGSSNDAAALAAAHIAATRHPIDPAILMRTLRERSRQLWHAGPAIEYCLSIGISSSEGLWGAFAGEDPNLTSLRKWITGYRTGAWSAALADQGIDDAALAAMLADAFITERKALHVVFPETRRVLEALRSRVRLGLITNGPPDVQCEKIEKSGLGAYFDTVVISGAVGYGKPRAEIFRIAMERMRCDGTPAVMVGDSLSRDVLGARNAGLRCIWVNRTGAVHDSGFPIPDAEVSDLSRIPELLDTML